MAKLTKTSVFKEYTAKQETTMDKTTRVARQMVEEESEQRHAKIIRLRNTRLERDANTPPATPATAPHKTDRR